MTSGGLPGRRDACWEGVGGVERGVGAGPRGAPPPPGHQQQVDPRQRLAVRWTVLYFTLLYIT